MKINGSRGGGEIPDPAEFDADPRPCITLRWQRSENRQARRNGKWVDVSCSEKDADE